MFNIWTPYAPDKDEEIMDLTPTSSCSLKEEPLSPAPTPPPPNPPHAPAAPWGYYIPASAEPTLQPMAYYSSQVTFQYREHPQTSPSTMLSYCGSVAEMLNCDIEVLDNDPEYIVFERDALRAMAEKNGGSLAGSNPRMRRSVRSSNEEQDGDYLEQRARNNAAAKQSRDRRKLREIKLALKVSFLEKQARKLQAILESGMCSKCFPHHDLY